MAQTQADWLAARRAAGQAAIKELERVAPGLLKEIRESVQNYPGNDHTDHLQTAVRAWLGHYDALMAVVEVVVDDLERRVELSDAGGISGPMEACTWYLRRLGYELAPETHPKVAPGDLVIIRTGGCTACDEPGCEPQVFDWLNGERTTHIRLLAVCPACGHAEEL